uniref:Uncharacterized protein n=1 Tax=Strigamia maritima TaxID=126957 RepID=T1IZ70_STRMM
MGLPSPPPMSKDSKNQSPPSSKTGSTPASPRRIIRNNKDLRPRRTESPKPSEDPRRSLSGSKLASSTKSNISHYYVDLAYIPHHGNPHYSNVEFFKRVRARYYVLSGINPSKEVLNSLLEAKQCWEDKNLEVTIIPTYDTDTLGYWVATNEDILTKNKIDLAPSASRCTINLQDHETSCSAYRLEF